MRLSVMLEPQEGLSYEQIRAVALRAASVGFAGFYRSDHYSSVADRAGQASTDAWATLAGLARETDRITLGTMVSPVTFRPAGNLAKVVATIAEMAGTIDGAPRIHLGMGTGWLEIEHRQYGFPFEDVGTRFRRLEEHLTAVRGLWDPTQDPFRFDGEFVAMDDARFAAIPQPRPRIIVGGKGRKRTPRLAARYADEMNAPFVSPQECRELRTALDEACEAEGRDPASIPLTVMTGCLVGASRSEFRDRAQRALETMGEGHLDAWLDGLSREWVLGEPERAADRLGEFADAGIAGVLLQDNLPDELDMLDGVMRDIAPRL